MTYELTLAGPEGDKAAELNWDRSGLFYKLGSAADEALRRHPLAVAERGRPRGFDHIHLSVIGGTDFIQWSGRKSNGFHYPIGRIMRIIRVNASDQSK